MRRAVPLLAFSLGACVNPRAKTTWDEDTAAGIKTVRTDTTRKTPPAVAAKTLEPPSLTPEQHAVRAHEMELALMHFGAQARAMRSEKGSWDGDSEARWRNLLDQLEEGLSQPLGVYPRRLMVQGRVTVETELELAERKYGPAPAPLKQRCKKLYARMAAHLLATPADAPTQISRHPLVLSWPVSPLVVTSSY
ncbi:MAG: hypothetical protein AAF449_24370, partial [Myxococcota bacterium]